MPPGRGPIGRVDAVSPPGLTHGCPPAWAPPLGQRTKVGTQGPAHRDDLPQLQAPACGQLWATWGPTHRNPWVARRAGGSRHTGAEKSSAPGLTPFSFLPSGPSFPLLPLWVEMLVGDSSAPGGCRRGEGWAQRPQAQARQPDSLQRKPGQPAGQDSASQPPTASTKFPKSGARDGGPWVSSGDPWGGQCEDEGCYPPSSRHPAGGGRTGTALWRGLGECLVRGGLPPVSPGPQTHLCLLIFL